ncbi:hypothetical protein [Pedobacter frigiditerrae]|uniref:hypothetical protein n=1 Tax=Pedobacter frigiditerrae TaxID=2530452 RepID=UPI0029308787|nr:hypothetical protein [Pedobacter frigiditerrae]
MGLDLYHFTPVRKVDDKKFLEFIPLDELANSAEYISRNEKFIVDLNPDEHSIVRGIYFDEKGFQRKGMSASFYTDFENDGVYFDLVSVLKAYRYLVADHISTLTELRLNFQENFIDNFIEGESIFVVSW